MFSFVTVESSSSTLPRPKFARLRPAPKRSHSVNDLSQCRRDPAGAHGLYGTSLLPPAPPPWDRLGPQTLHLPQPSLTKCGAGEKHGEPPAPTLHPEAREEGTQSLHSSPCVSLVGCLKPVCLERKAHLIFSSSW